MRLSKHFEIEEFVYPQLFAKFGANSRWFIDPRVVSIAEYIREGLGPIIINNWHDGGDYKESGLRSFNTLTGSSFSQHKFARAADLKSPKRTPEELFDFIKHNLKDLMELGLTTVEDISMTPTWLHIDVRQTNLDYLLIVKP